MRIKVRGKNYAISRHMGIYKAGDKAIQSVYRWNGFCLFDVGISS
jgi:hypothetical protein